MKIERKIKIGVMGCANIAKKSFIPSILSGLSPCGGELNNAPGCPPQQFFACLEL